MSAGAPGERVFSYGTLQLPGVQIATYGRLLIGTADTLGGFAITTIRIEDPDVLDASGMADHLALVPDDAAAPIPGMVFTLSAAELAATDEYEGENYARVPVTLGSGAVAWVYVKA